VTHRVDEFWTFLIHALLKQLKRYPLQSQLT